MSHLIFAYGSNLNQSDLDRYTTERKTAAVFPRKVCNAYLQGWRIGWTAYSKVRQCGVLNLVPDKEARTWGVLFSLTDEELALFDRKEGHPKHYRRTPVTAYDSDGNAYDAETYVAYPCAKTEHFYPNRHYLTVVIEGMKTHDLPETYIQDLKQRSPVIDLPQPGSSTRRTAIYSGCGVSGSTLCYWQDLFLRHDLGKLEILYSHLFTKEKLSNYDLLILPGGGGKAICSGLGDMGKSNVRHFVQTGGCLLGVCAGAFAVTHQTPAYLGISPFVVQDFKHTKRGEALLKVLFTSKGRNSFGMADEDAVEVIYHNGPVVVFSEWRNCRDAEILATFAEEICHPEGEKGIMTGSPAAWCNRYGDGWVYAISPHFERTPGKEGFMARLIEGLPLPANGI